MKFTISYCSERGKNKSACEDSALIGRLAVNEEAGTVELSTPFWVCICDGVGGVAGGKEASMFVARELSDRSAPESADDVKSIFVEINNRLLERAQKTPDHKKMSTTATALYFDDKAVYLAHVGDARLYAKHGGFARQLTVDQTAYQWFTNHHLRIFATERNKEAIYGAMGGKAKLLKPLVVKQLPREQLGRTMLLTTDGVHDFLSQTELDEILNRDVPTEDKAKLLCSAALERGSKDDRTAVIIYSEDHPE